MLFVCNELKLEISEAEAQLTLPPTTQGLKQKVREVLHYLSEKAAFQLR